MYFTAGIDNEMHGLFGSLTPVAPGTPEGPAEGQVVVAASDVVQIDLTTLNHDIASGASASTIAQDMQTLNTDIATLQGAERVFAKDSRDDLGSDPGTTLDTRPAQPDPLSPKSSILSASL